MTGSQATQNDDEFFFANLTQYLDGELKEQDQARFQALHGQDKFKNVPNRFAQQKGLLQLHLQAFSLTQRQHLELQGKIQNQEAAATIEALKISEVASTLARSNVKRSFGLACLVLGLCYIAYGVFSPAPKQAFKPLEALSYEALVMDEDSSNGRLSLPSSLDEEISQFLIQTPGIGFSPLKLKQVPRGWKVDGASIIDYEITKITVTQYSNDTTKVFFFALAGKAKTLPAADVIRVGSLDLRPYGTDRINLVAWQADPRTLAVVAGRSSIKDLMAFATQAITVSR